MKNFIYFLTAIITIIFLFSSDKLKAQQLHGDKIVCHEATHNYYVDNSSTTVTYQYQWTVSNGKFFNNSTVWTGFNSIDVTWNDVAANANKGSGRRYCSVVRRDKRIVANRKVEYRASESQKPYYLIPYLIR